MVLSVGKLPVSRVKTCSTTSIRTCTRMSTVKILSLSPQKLLNSLKPMVRVTKLFIARSCMAKMNTVWCML